MNGNKILLDANAFIIAASALHLEAPLVSADMDFQKVAGLTLISDILI